MSGGGGAEGDPRAPPGEQRSQRDTVGPVGKGKLGHQGDALTGRYQGQHRGEIVGIMTDPRGEPCPLAEPDGHEVAQRAGAGHDPRLLTRG
jgi:hypothetical protein